MLVIIGVLMTPVFACAVEEICLSDGYTEAAVIGTEAEVLADLPVDEDGNIGSDSRFLTRRLIVLSAAAAPYRSGRPQKMRSCSSTKLRQRLKPPGKS